MTIKELNFLTCVFFPHMLEQDGSIILGIKPVQKFVNEIKFSDVYGVEFINYGLINGSRQSKSQQCFQGRASHGSEVCFGFLLNLCDVCFCQ